MDHAQDVVGLTDLAQELHTFTRALVQHTETRSSLYSALQEEDTQLVKEIIFCFNDGGPSAYINPIQLHPDVAEMFLTNALEHEAKMTLDTWSRIKHVVDTAMHIIKTIEADVE